MALSCPLAHGRRSTIRIRESFFFFLLCVYFKPIFKTWRFAHTHKMCKYNSDSLLGSKGEAENMQSWHYNWSYLPEIHDAAEKLESKRF